MLYNLYKLKGPQRFYKTKITFENKSLKTKNTFISNQRPETSQVNTKPEKTLYKIKKEIGERGKIPINSDSERRPSIGPWSSAPWSNIKFCLMFKKIPMLKSQFHYLSHTAFINQTISSEQNISISLRVANNHTLPHDTLNKLKFYC